MRQSKFRYGVKVLNVVEAARRREFVKRMVATFGRQYPSFPASRRRQQGKDLSSRGNRPSPVPEISGCSSSPSVIAQRHRPAHHQGRQTALVDSEDSPEELATLTGLCGGV